MSDPAAPPSLRAGDMVRCHNRGTVHPPGPVCQLVAATADGCTLHNREAGGNVQLPNVKEADLEFVSRQLEYDDFGDPVVVPWATHQ